MLEPNHEKEELLRRWNKKAWALILLSGLSGAGAFWGGVSGQGMSLEQALLPMGIGFLFGAIVSGASIQITRQHFVPMMELVPSRWVKRICEAHPQAANLPDEDFLRTFKATQLAVARESFSRALNLLSVVLVLAYLLFAPALIHGKKLTPLIQSQETLDQLAQRYPDALTKEQSQVYQATAWDLYCYRMAKSRLALGLFAGFYLASFVLILILVRHSNRRIVERFMGMARSMGLEPDQKQ